MDPKDTNKNQKEKSNAEKPLFGKMTANAQKAGIVVIYAGLVLFYTLRDPDIPLWVKLLIVGALGYFVSPIDVIPDFAPVAGFLDDLGVLLMTIAAVALYINDEAREKASMKLYDWFGDFDPDDLKSVNDRMKR